MEKTDRELLEEMNARLEKMQWQMEANKRRRLIVLGVILLVIIILAVIIVPKAVSAYRQYLEVVNKINGITEMVNSAIDAEKIKSITENFSKFDIDKFSDIASKLDGIDFEKIEQMMEKLNSIDFSSLGNMISKIESIGSKFPGLFA